MPSPSDSEIIQACRGEGTMGEIAQGLGISVPTLYRARRRLGLLDNSRDNDNTEPHGPRLETDGDGFPVAVSSVGPVVRTVAELIEACEVDLEQWEVYKKVLNRWGPAQEPNWQVKAWLKLRSAMDPTHVKAEMLAEIAKAAPRRKKIKRAKAKERLALEVAIYDLHLGKYAAAEETGATYDMTTAADLFREVVARIIQRAESFPVESIVFPIGNDWGHVDNVHGTTTQGTPQDVAARLWEIARQGRELLVEAVDALSEVAPVEVVSVPGNHDYASTFFMAEILSAWYRHDANVQVDIGPAPRKYWRYGSNLVGFTHGKSEKKAALPILMAQEAGKDWAQTRFREWHLGHVHHRSAEEHQGVRVRTIPSLAAADAWHAIHGHYGLRAAEAFLWSHEEGEAATFSFAA